MNLTPILRGALSLLLCLSCTTLCAQKVIFPQEQQAGSAKVETVDDGYTIGNDLFTAKFVKADGKLTFGGCEELGLLAGTEIFKVQLGDGTEIPASAFMLGDVEVESLAGNSAAVKASRRYNGQQIKATFTHESGLKIEWRAVLRDGSHYLRTEMDILNSGSEGINMNSIYPMMYTVQNVDGEKAPVVVGNTRGAVIASDKIFAGVETPTAYNMAGEATDLESFVFKAWDNHTAGTSNPWLWMPESKEIPDGIKALSQYQEGTVLGSRGYLVFRQAGDCTITLDYTGGSNRLQILGVDILDVKGTVIASDYHFGFTGGSDSNRDYTVTIPEVGAYMVRIFVTNAGNGEGYKSKGTIAYSKKVAQPELVYDLASNATPYYTSSNDQNNATATVHLARSVATLTSELSAITLGTYVIEEGKEYYLAANAKQNNNNEFKPQYVYFDNNNTNTVKANSNYANNEQYRWTVEKGTSDNGWYIKNAGGKYLSYNGCIVMADEKYEFILSDDAVFKMLGAFSLKHQSDGSKYAVCNNDGGTFASGWKYANAGNDNSWCSDYILLPCTPNGTFAQSNFSQVAATAVPAELKPTYDHPNVYSAEYSVTSEEAGQFELTLDYYNGNKRLNVIGVEVIDESGETIYGGDLHYGYSGGVNKANTYSVFIPAGTSTVRIYEETKTEGLSDASGDIYTSFKALDKLNAESTTANYKWDTRNNNWSAFTDWTGTLPEDVNNPGTAKYIDHYYTMGVGFVNVEFDYSESIGASHKINTLGVQLLDLKGNLVSQDFHNGASGTNSKATYKVVVPEEGVYILRSIVCRTSGDYNTAGDTNISFEAINYGNITGATTTAAKWYDTESTDVTTIPAGIAALKNENGVAITQVKSSGAYFHIKPGKLSVKYTWITNSGNQRINTVGLEVVDLFGNVVASDYHWGYAGSGFKNNTYSVKILEEGIYYVRYYAETNTNVLNSDADVTFTLVETKVLGTIGEDETLADAWTPSDWKTMPADEVPNRVNEVGCSDANARVIEQQITITSAGTLSVEFLYKEGSARLNMVGVDLVDATGSVAVDDYHAGYTGTEKSGNVYKFNVFAPGTYTIRYFADNSEAINSTGNINIKLSVDYTLHLVAPATTPLVGKWSRITTLAAGEEWNISAVVGVIAPGQARRSFLCYSERERAVPWRAVPAYISWYELNINRNNAAPGKEHENFTEAQCLPILSEWKTQLYDKYGEAPYAFVWDDGWDTYGEWQFHSGFPNGFTNMDEIGRQMGAGQGAWLGPVGGYGTSGGYRKNYWNSTKTGGMQLSNPLYYEVFVNAVTGLLRDKGYDFRFFKFDGISAQFSSVGPDAGATGNENAEAIIMAEKVLRGIKEDVFLNTTVGTWASPFWFQHTDAIWRQEKDDGTIGNNSNNRENWITYRDRLVYQNYVQNSPLCPINTLMTHGFILTEFGGPAGFSRDWKSVLNELRCAFACGSGMVELYNDYKLTNELANPAGEKGALWGEIAKCMQWQRKNADVLPDIHWVGGNPWTGAKAEVYGWAAWNGKNAVLTLRNGANDAQQYKFTLREALDIPEYVKTSITLTKAFADQAGLIGLNEGEAIDIDAELTVTLPGSSVYVFDGIDNTPVVTIPAVISSHKIGTFYANDAVEIPEGVTAYVATQEPTLEQEDGAAEATGVITLTAIQDGIIPAKTGTIICGEEGTYMFTSTTDAGTVVDENLLKGYDGQEQYENVSLEEGANYYVLSVKNNIAGFYKKNAAFKVYDNKAYLRVPEIKASTLRISFGNDGPTGVTDIILNGTMPQAVFDLQGRRVKNPQKGVYIVGGKKVVF